ncbi:MAG: DUF308 domain-containing protein [Bacteroidetes bacterium]|uniref:DUF308 domain-containing protein n=1 Tax=Candidatus Egerieousia excrementavium TaxID=2840778 RepID=A0A9D9DKM8_9BACT|nr:DUF308 domain-containing protein [Candidatus Egerieousia excrementavium]
MNIIYSITNRTSSLIRGMIFFVLGILLLFWPDQMLNFIVKILAAVLIVISIVSLVLMYKGDRKVVGEAPSPLSYFAFAAMIVCLVFGVLVFAFPDFFTGIIVFLFGLLLILLGVAQITNMAVSSRYMKLPVWLYIFPVVIAACGIICFFKPFEARSAITVFFGAVVTLYGAVEIASSWMLRKIRFGEDGKYVEIKSEIGK